VINMKVIGITGGIASGKSVVTKILQKRFSYLVIDADQMAREAVVSGSEGLKGIVEAFGPQFLLANGELNRSLLGETIANDEKARELLNSIVHPFIGKIYEEKIKLYTNQGAPMVFYDCPLLFEAGLQDTVDEIILVIADRDLRINRIMARDGISRELAAKKIDMQMDDSEKIKQADVIIENNGTLDDLLITLNGYFSRRKLWVK